MSIYLLLIWLCAYLNLTLAAWSWHVFISKDRIKRHHILIFTRAFLIGWESIHSVITFLNLQPELMIGIWCTGTRFGSSCSCLSKCAHLLQNGSFIESMNLKWWFSMWVVTLPWIAIKLWGSRSVLWWWRHYNFNGTEIWFEHWFAFIISFLDIY